MPNNLDLIDKPIILLKEKFYSYLKKNVNWIILVELSRIIDKFA